MGKYRIFDANALFRVIHTVHNSLTHNLIIKKYTQPNLKLADVTETSAKCKLIPITYNVKCILNTT